MKQSCGTLSYMAPEVLEEKGYGQKVDMWSIGVVVFILLMGYMPFAGEQKVQMDNIIAGRYKRKEKPWNRLSEDAKTFIQALLETDPDKRLSAAEALAHPFITHADSQAGEIDSSVIDSIKAFSNASQFRRACFSMMAWSLSNEERAQVRQAFIEMDTDNSGVLSLDNVKDVLQKQVQVSDEDIQMIYDKLDGNSTQTVNYTEFLAAMMTVRIGANTNLINQAFDRFDVDNTGYITPENLKAMLTVRLKGTTVEEMIAEADFTKNGKISREEFIRYINGEDATKEMSQASLA